MGGSNISSENGLEHQSLPNHVIDSPEKVSESSSSTQTEVLTEYSIFIEKLSPILEEMKKENGVVNVPAIQKAVESIEMDYNRAKTFIGSPNFVASPGKHIEGLAQNLGRSLGLVLFASHDIPISNKEKIESLRRDLMNIRFDLSSDRDDSEFGNEIEEEETERNTDEGDRITLDTDDIILQLKCGEDEEFKNALLGLNSLIMDGMIANESLDHENLIDVLCNRLCSSEGSFERISLMQILMHLIEENEQYKEKATDLGFLSMLVKSLARETEEQNVAVRLLLKLSDIPAVRRRIGRIYGCIAMLVSILNGDDQEASQAAGKLLNALSGNIQHVLNMAEAGYFRPLIKYLKEGSDMSKILMASTLSRMELTDQNKASLGEDGVIEPLINMFNTGNLEAKMSALNALQNLSTLKQNIQRLIDSGMVGALLQLLFSVTSVLMTLREPASAILAKVAQCESILVKQDIAQQMLSLLNLSSPVIQSHLLDALNYISSHPSASKVRKKMKENGAIQLILPFVNEADPKLRVEALRLVYTLSKDIQGELTEQLGDTYLNVMTHTVSTSTSTCEKAAAVGILSNLPISDKKVTETLKNANLLPVLISLTSSSPQESTPVNMSLAESIASLLIRFTVPLDKKLQHYAVDHGVVPILLKLLKNGPPTAKLRAATCLAQLSQNSMDLSKSKKLKWFCVPPPTDAICEVHDGYCSVKGTFCLVKAGAIPPLIQVLEEGNVREAHEAVLSCLATLLHDEIWENGSNYLVKISGVEAIIRVFEYGSSRCQEKALWILERVFRIEGHRTKYSESAQVVLIDLAQNGDPILKPSVAKLLAQLEILQVQSSYF